MNHGMHTCVREPPLLLFTLLPTTPSVTKLAGSSTSGASSKTAKTMAGEARDGSDVNTLRYGTLLQVLKGTAALRLIQYGFKRQHACIIVRLLV